jgi:signal transduction histidine kinase
VFKRFFRLEHSRTTPGSGLGLSLVAAVADLHGVRIELGDNRPGLKVQLTFALRTFSGGAPPGTLAIAAARIVTARGG